MMVTNSMPLVYIAGPFSGPNSWEVEQNIRKAEEFILPIAELGASPVCPHSMTRFFNGTLTYDFWIQSTLALLARCDAIFLRPDWIRSKGAQGEFVFAVKHKIPDFVSLSSLRTWIRGRT